MNNNEIYIISELLDFTDSLNNDYRVNFTDFSLKFYKSKINILVSILLKEDLLIRDDNDEIVLEINFKRDLNEIKSDITDSLGFYYYEYHSKFTEDFLENLKKYIFNSMGELIN